MAGVTSRTCTGLAPWSNPNSAGVLADSWYRTTVEWVVVEREFPEALTPDRVRELAAKANGCLDLYRVEGVRSYLSPDGTRMICVFRAPDAESVRMALRDGGSPPATVWSSTLHTP